MTMNGRLALLLALAGGVAVGTAITLNRQKDRRQFEKKQHKTDLQSWEGEGGSVATAQHRP